MCTPPPSHIHIWGLGFQRSLFSQSVTVHASICFLTSGIPLYLSHTSFSPAGLCQLYPWTVILAGLEAEINVCLSYTHFHACFHKIIQPKRDLHNLGHFFCEKSVFQVDKPICETDRSGAILVVAGKPTRFASDCS